MQKDVVVINRTYLLTRLVHAVDVKFLRREHHKSARRCISRVPWNGSIHILASITIEHCWRGREFPPAVVMAVIVVNDILDINKYLRPVCCRCLYIIGQGSGVQLNVQGGGRNPIVVDSILCHVMSGWNRVVGYI